MAVIKNKRILKYLLMMVVSLLLVLIFSIGVSVSTNYDRQEADACITISERLSVKGGSDLVPKSLLKGKAYTSVYYGIKDSKNDYVSITNNISRRQTQHGDRLIEITDEPLTRRQARAIEQVLIEDNPQFSNKINSISLKRDWYNDATEWARKWLSEH